MLQQFWLWVVFEIVFLFVAWFVSGVWFFLLDPLEVLSAHTLDKENGEFNETPAAITWLRHRYWHTVLYNLYTNLASICWFDWCSYFTSQVNKNHVRMLHLLKCSYFKLSPSCVGEHALECAVWALSTFCLSMYSFCVFLLYIGEKIGVLISIVSVSMAKRFAWT